VSVTSRGAGARSSSRASRRGCKRSKGEKNSKVKKKGGFEEENRKDAQSKGGEQRKKKKKEREERKKARRIIEQEMVYPAKGIKGAKIKIKN